MSLSSSRPLRCGLLVRAVVLDYALDSLVGYTAAKNIVIVAIVGLNGQPISLEFFLGNTISRVVII